MTTSVFQNLESILEDAGVEPRGVIHVGAHKGQEVAVFERAGFDDIILVEANPTLAKSLRKRFPDYTVHAVGAGLTGEGHLNVTKWDERSSLYEPTRDEVVETITIPIVAVTNLQGAANVLVLDCQGAELECLMTTDLPRIDLIIVEVSEEQRYDSAPLQNKIRDWLTGRGWVMRSTWSEGHSPGITDDVWVRDG